MKSNNVATLLNFFVFTQNKDLFNWVEASLKLSSLCINNTTHNLVKEIDSNFIDNNTTNILVVEELLYAKLVSKLKSVFPLSEYNFSILILTNSRRPNITNSLSMATVDYVPWGSVSVYMFEHLINSLIKDFKQNKTLQNLAHFDPLTKAANQRLFEDRGRQIIKRSKRYKEPLSLLYFDLDDFKLVNDSLGHEVGDLLLIKFVEIIQKCRRETDTLARLGGDEFALLLPNTTQENARTIVNKIINYLSEEKNIQGNAILIKSSIGSVSIDANNLKDITLRDILKLADIAVYEAKKIAGTSVYHS